MRANSYLQYKNGACMFSRRRLPDKPETPDTPDNPDSKAIEEESKKVEKGRLYDFKAPTFTGHGPRPTFFYTLTSTVRSARSTWAESIVAFCCSSLALFAMAEMS